MQNKTLKSLLVKFLTVLCALCCCLGLVCGLVGCGEEVRSIVKTEINDKGELVIHYNIGEPENLGVVVGANGAPGANGAQGGILGDCEQHDFVTYTAQQATCQVEEIKVNFCTKCKGYDVVVGQTNGDVHGTFKKEIITDSATGDKVIIDYFESAIVELPAKPGDVAGSCLEKQCELCEKFLATHQNTEKVPVDTGASICEEEHLEILICSDCKNPILDAEGNQQITKEPARGHAYAPEAGTEVLDDKSTADVKDDEYTVTLICSVCGDDDTVKAVYNAEKSVPVTCQQAGYDIFTYTYETYDAEEGKVVSKTVDLKKNEAGISPLHIFELGEYKLDKVANNAVITYTADNTETLNALTAGNRPVIELLEGEERDCETWANAVGRCALCDELINVTINDAHEYDAEVPADCINDAYIPCKNCDVKEVTTLAIGHVWEYKAGSVDIIANTAVLECATEGCTATKTVNVTAGTVVPATSCKEYPITPYTTEAVDNGLDASHANYDDEIVVVFEYEDKTATPVHAYIDAAGKTLFTVENGADVDYNGYIGAMIVDGKTIEDGYIEWTVDGAANCQGRKEAMFRCPECEKIVKVMLQGPHNEVGELKTFDATCTVNGYTYKDCSEGCIVKYDVVPAQGHEFEVVDKDAFIVMVKANREAAVVDTTTIAIECECGDTATATLVKKEFAAGDPNSCAPFDTYTYTFEYAAAAEDDLAAKTYTFVITDTDGYEAHKITGIADKFFANGQENVPYADVAAAIAAGDLEWIAGEPGDCVDTAEAVFRCTLCDKLIKINVFGEEILVEGYVNAAGTPVDGFVQPTCTEDGVTYQYCTQGHLVEVNRIEKISHAYTWTPGTVTVTYDALGLVETVVITDATATCANDDTHTLIASVADEAATIQAIKDAQDCCDTVSVEVEFVYNTEVVASTIKVINPNGAHDYGTIEKIITIGEDTYKYCYAGNKYIKQ